MLVLDLEPQEIPTHLKQLTMLRLKFYEAEEPPSPKNYLELGDE
mgnify:CR=1 FL=1